MQWQDSVAQDHSFLNWHHANKVGAKYNKVLQHSREASNFSSGSDFLPIRAGDQESWQGIRNLGINLIDEMHWGKIKPPCACTPW